MHLRNLRVVDKKLFWLFWPDAFLFFFAALFFYFWWGSKFYFCWPLFIFFWSASRFYFCGVSRFFSGSQFLLRPFLIFSRGRKFFSPYQNILFSGEVFICASPQIVSAPGRSRLRPGRCAENLPVAMLDRTLGKPDKR